MIHLAHDSFSVHLPHFTRKHCFYISIKLKIENSTLRRKKVAVNAVNILLVKTNCFLIKFMLSVWCININHFLWILFLLLDLPHLPHLPLLYSLNICFLILVFLVICKQN